VANGALPAVYWMAFAPLGSEAACTAALLAGVDNARRGRSNVVVRTRLGDDITSWKSSHAHVRALRLRMAHTAVWINSPVMPKERHYGEERATLLAGAA
jgi:hypothetical protein